MGLGKDSIQTRQYMFGNVLRCKRFSLTARIEGVEYIKEGSQIYADTLILCWVRCMYLPQLLRDLSKHRASCDALHELLDRLVFHRRYLWLTILRFLIRETV